MRPWLQWLLDFYRDHEKFAIALASAVATWLLSRVLPNVLSFIRKALSELGRKFGGRFAHKTIQDAYLNWVVLQNQDLNLTGIIGSGEKPELEQIFISLRVVEELGAQTREDAEIGEEESKERTIWKSIVDRGIGVLTQFRSEVLGLSVSIADKTIGREPIPSLALFRPRRFWRIRLIWERNEVSDTSLAVLFTLLFVVMLFYGLFLESDINNVFAGCGTFVWSLVAIIGIVALADDFKDLTNWMWAGILTGLPSIAIAYVLRVKVVLGHQSPLAVGIGATLALLSAMFFVWIDRGGELHRGGKERTAKEVGKLLSSHDNLAILGKPGAGKSTYVQFIALTFAQEKAGERKLRKPGIVRRRFGTRRQLLPILIPLRKISHFLVEADPQLGGNLLIEAFRQRVLPSDIRAVFPSSYVLHMLRKRRCLFVLDGLDEVADDIEFQALVREIMGLISCFPGNKFVITSRYAGWRGGLGSSFRQFEIEDLNDEEIADFIDSWYRAIEENRARIAAGTESPAERLHRRRRAEESANNLIAALREVESIQSLAENPLLLSIICFVHYHKTLPKERLSLYQDCSDLLLVQWDREKGLPVDDTHLTLARKEAIMQEVAFALHSGRIGARLGRKEATCGEIIPIVESMLERFEMDPTQAVALFQKLIDRSGIIVVVEQFTDRYAFSHLTFQEFYAAKYLHEKHLDIFDTIGQVTDGSSDGLTNWWREVVLLYNAMQRDPSRIIERLCRDDERDLLKRRLQIAAQCLSEAVEVPSHEVEETVLTQVLRIRSNGNETSSTELFQPELKHYLLRFATSADFYKHVLSTSIRQVRRVEEAIELTSSLSQMVSSVDREIQLASINALINLGQRHDISQALDRETLEVLLSDTNAEVQLATIQLILSVLSRPLNDGLSRKFVETTLTLVASLLYSVRFLARTRILLSEELVFGSQVDEKALCRVLRETVGAISGAERLNTQQQLARMLYRAMGGEDIGLSSLVMPTEERILLFLGIELPLGLAVCVANALIQLDDSNQRSMHKQQLLDALNKGTPDQQVWATHLLTGTFGSESDVADSILFNLESPFSKVRLAALSALQRLHLSNQQLPLAQDVLIRGLEEVSRLRWLQCHLRQMIAGKGCLALGQEERIRAAETLLVLNTTSAKSVINTLLSWYKELPASRSLARLPRSRWFAIGKMPEGVTSKLSEDDIGKIVALYEQDRTDLGSSWSADEHSAAIETIGNLGEWYNEEQRDKVSSILFDLLRSESDGISLAALRALDKLPPTVVTGSEQHQLLLQGLRSRQYSVADTAFDILLSNQLV